MLIFLHLGGFLGNYLVSKLIEYMKCIHNDVYLEPFDMIL